jgi:hypothetical protein
MFISGAVRQASGSNRRRVHRPRSWSHTWALTRKLCLRPRCHLHLSWRRAPYRLPFSSPLLYVARQRRSTTPATSAWTPNAWKTLLSWALQVAQGLTAAPNSAPLYFPNTSRPGSTWWRSHYPLSRLFGWRSSCCPRDLRNGHGGGSALDEPRRDSCGLSCGEI